MFQRLCRLIFYKWMGWKTVVKVPDFDKCILCVAPHTSNWDFIIAELFYGAIGRKAHFLMKKEWFIFPLNFILRAIGGIPVNRGRKMSMVDQIIEKAEETSHFCLAITPEATRKPNPDWRHGFYYMALGADLPIVLYAVDYRSKTIYGEKVIYPSGDINRDMNEIKRYYLNFQDKGKFPKNFTVGEIADEQE